MRRVAVVGFASEVVLEPDGRNEAELVAPVIDRALAAAQVSAADVGIVASAGSEFLNGVVGTVMGAFDGLPCWPPCTHVHLEGDGAFALYEAWVRLLAGEADVALVCAFSRPFAADPVSVLGLQLDPYLVAPLAPGPRSLAALQARALLDSGRYGEADLAGVVAARRRGVQADDARPRALRRVPAPRTRLLDRLPGAAALVLAADGRAGTPGGTPGVDHRHGTGDRDRGVRAGATSPCPPPPGRRPSAWGSPGQSSTCWRCTGRSATRS